MMGYSSTDVARKSLLSRTSTTVWCSGVRGCSNALPSAPALMNENRGLKTELLLAVTLANHGGRRFVPA